MCPPLRSKRGADLPDRHIEWPSPFLCSVATYSNNKCDQRSVQQVLNHTAVLSQQRVMPLSDKNGASRTRERARHLGTRRHRMVASRCRGGCQARKLETGKIHLLAKCDSQCCIMRNARDSQTPASPPWQRRQHTSNKQMCIDMTNIHAPIGKIALKRKTGFAIETLVHLQIFLAEWITRRGHNISLKALIEEVTSVDRRCSQGLHNLSKTAQRRTHHETRLGQTLFRSMTK